MTKVKTSHAQKKRLAGGSVSIQSLQATSRAGSSDTLTASARIARRLYNEALGGSDIKRHRTAQKEDASQRYGS